MAGETKKRIIETALALFSQSGYLATSMNDIAQQVGLTKAALYQAFFGQAGDTGLHHRADGAHGSGAGAGIRDARDRTGRLR